MATALERARHNMARLRQRVRQQEPVRAAGAFLGGAAVGSLERSGILPPSLMGFPTKPVVGAVVHMLAGNLTGTWGAVAHGAGDGIFGAYGYAAGKSGTLIAGDAEDTMLGFETA